jgi:hypothetical protein
MKDLQLGLHKKEADAHAEDDYETFMADADTTMRMKKLQRPMV